jgi:integral membrane protein
MNVYKVWRVLALTVGTLLLPLYTDLLLRLFGTHIPGVAQFVGVGHGFVYIVYVLFTLTLARERGWPIQRVGIVLAVGLLPVVTFLVEHRVTAEERARVAALA